MTYTPPFSITSPILALSHGSPLWQDFFKFVQRRVYTTHYASKCALINLSYFSTSPYRLVLGAGSDILKNPS